MPSADLYGACVAFLDGDSGDIRTAVNAEQTGLLAAGSVTTARQRRGKQASRGRNVAAVAIDISPVTPAPARAIGPGFRIADAAFDLEVTVRQRDLPQGKNQLTVLREIQRALVFRYDGMTNLVIPVTTGTATFRYASATEGLIDEAADSSELVSGTVRAVFSFSEEQGSNT